MLKELPFQTTLRERVAYNVERAAFINNVERESCRSSCSCSSKELPYNVERVAFLNNIERQICRRCRKMSKELPYNVERVAVQF